MIFFNAQMKFIKRAQTLLRTACVAILVVHGGHLWASSGEVTDMLGRKVTIGHTKKVWPTYPPITYLVYAIDPELLVGWNMPLTPESKKYIRPAQQQLPVIGGWFGPRTPNMENLATIKPDLALAWDQTLFSTPNMVKTLDHLGIPVLGVKLFYLSDYPEAFRFVGKVLDRSKRANELAEYVDHTLEEMKTFSASIPNNKKASIFYAIGPDGLTLDCNHLPFISDVIQLAGGRMAFQCPSGSKQVGSKIDPERLMVNNPDVIITQDDVFYKNVYTDPRFKLLKAVRNRKVFMIPKTPMNWLNFPPTFMRAIGVRWLAHHFYPNLYSADKLRNETKYFFKMFFEADITADEANTLLLLKKSSN